MFEWSGVQWASTRGASTGVTAVHGEEGQFPEYQILMHEANPMDRRPLHSYLGSDQESEVVYRVVFFLFRREIVPHAHRMPIRVTTCWPASGLQTLIKIDAPVA